MKILLLAASPFLQTAYGYIGRCLGKTLALKHEVYYFGAKYYGLPYSRDGYVLLPTALSSSGQEIKTGTERAIAAINRIKPDVLVTLGDLLFLKYLEVVRERPYWIGYFPVESDPFRPSEIGTARKMDLAVVPTKWGQRVLKRDGVEAEYIPHPLNPSFYHVRKEKARSMLLTTEDRDLKKQFIFGYCGTNVERKRIDRLMEAFKRAFKGEEDVLLWLNTPTTDPLGWDLPYMSKVLGIEKQVVFTSYVDFFPPSEEELNTIFNSSDFHVTASSGEGFCLPVLETMSLGKPQIGTKYSSLPELIGDSGIQVPPREIVFGNLGHRALVDIDLLAEAMRKMYENEEARRVFSARAEERGKEYEYKRVMVQWLSLLDRVEEDLFG